MANGQPSIGQSILGPTGQPLPTDPITPPPSNMQSRASEFSAFFKQPEVQAALIQAGATLLSPSVGESSTGNFGRAISAGAAAAGRVGGERQRQTEVAAGQEQQERRTAAVESQAATSQQLADQQLVLAREGREADVTNLATRLAADLDVALVGGELRLLTELVRGEIENAFLQSRAVDVQGVIEQFNTTRSAVGSVGTSALPITPSGGSVPPGGTGAPSTSETPPTGTETPATGGLPSGVPAPVVNMTEEQIDSLRRASPAVDAVTDDFLRRMFANETSMFLMRKVYGDEQVEAWKQRIGAE